MRDDQMSGLFESILGIPPRASDMAVMHVLSPEPTIADVAEYIWDHWMGEPDEPTLGHS
jgi:hypothetical protein